MGMRCWRWRISGGVAGSSDGLTLGRLFAYCLTRPVALEVWFSAQLAPSSRGPGHRPFTAATWVRIPLGSLGRPAPASRAVESLGKTGRFLLFGLSRAAILGILPSLFHAVISKT